MFFESDVTIPVPHRKVWDCLVERRSVIVYKGEVNP
jgi:hypothetical protein